VAWVALSAALSTHVIYSVQYLLQIGAGVLLYFTVGYHFRQSKHLSLLAGTIVFLGAAAALGGLAQFQIRVWTVHALCLVTLSLSARS
jgi:uncharacterized membrane protein (Fun14 family)